MSADDIDACRRDPPRADDSPASACSRGTSTPAAATTWNFGGLRKPGRSPRRRRRHVRAGSRTSRRSARAATPGGSDDLTRGGPRMQVGWAEADEAPRLDAAGPRTPALGDSVEVDAQPDAAAGRDRLGEHRRARHAGAAARSHADAHRSSRRIASTSTRSPIRARPRRYGARLPVRPPPPQGRRRSSCARRGRCRRTSSSRSTRSRSCRSAATPRSARSPPRGSSEINWLATLAGREARLPRRLAALDRRAALGAPARQHPLHRVAAGARRRVGGPDADAARHRARAVHPACDPHARGEAQPTGSASCWPRRPRAARCRTAAGRAPRPCSTRRPCTCRA